MLENFAFGKGGAFWLAGRRFELDHRRKQRQISLIMITAPPTRRPAPRISGFGVSVGSAAANRFRFSGKWFHPTSGLYDYGFRWHEPETRRRFTRDPLGEFGGLNLRDFVGNEMLSEKSVSRCLPNTRPPKRKPVYVTDVLFI